MIQLHLLQSIKNAPRIYIISVTIIHLITFRNGSSDIHNICHFSVVCYCAELVPLILCRRRNHGSDQRNCVRSSAVVLPLFHHVIAIANAYSDHFAMCS